MKLFLDLEKTVIEEFDDFCWLLPNNVNKIDSFIHKNEITSITIWSWAISDLDNTDFIIDKLERHFGLPVDVITIEEMLRVAFPNIRWQSSADIWEVLSVHTKDSLLWKFLNEANLPYG